MGGWIALEFTLTYPDAVDALVLADAVVRHYPYPAGWGANLPRVNQIARESDLDAAKQLWLADPVFAQSREIPEVAARLRGMVEEYSGLAVPPRQPAPAPAASRHRAARRGRRPDPLARQARRPPLTGEARRIARAKTGRNCLT